MLTAVFIRTYVMPISATILVVTLAVDFNNARRELELYREIEILTKQESKDIPQDLGLVLSF